MFLLTYEPLKMHIELWIFIYTQTQFEDFLLFFHSNGDKSMQCLQNILTQNKKKYIFCWFASLLVEFQLSFRARADG